MNERKQTTREEADGTGAADLLEERLQALFAVADPSADPTEGLERRVTQLAARHATRAARRSFWWIPSPIAWRPLAGAAAAILLLILGLTVLHPWEHSRLNQTVQQPGHDQIARVSPSAPQTARPVRGDQSVKASSPPPRTGVRSNAASSSLENRTERKVGIRHPTPNTQHPTPIRDDIEYVNGDAAASPGWPALSLDARDAIERKIRRLVRVRDDFVQVPFPRLVSTTDEQIAAAVESYKREAAIVDARLSREVTLAFKATAFSDLCDRLRAETGIRLEAGASVADEKVTLFCEKMPLREVMRQLAHPFGYTWLRSGKEREYRYELVQDLRSQLMEEDLRNRDHNAALLALEREMERYRPYLSLSPDEALARSQSAGPGEKKLLEKLASNGWGPIQMYFRLSRDDLAMLRTEHKLKFGLEPQQGERQLPEGLARPVLQSLRDRRVVRVDGQLGHARGDEPNAMPLTAVPEARALVNLTLNESELGQFTFGGSSGFRISGKKVMSLTGSGPYAVGLSPTVLKPENATANAGLAHDPALRHPISMRPQSSCAGGVAANTDPEGTTASPHHPTASPPAGAALEPKVTSADVLEALHRATGAPICADYYTRLFPARDVSVQSQALFDAVNHIADTMRLRWTKEGDWLQFRSASFYDDRVKEVPNRLLNRWAASRRQHGALTLEDLIEIAGLSDAQLNATSMAEGARECFGLVEWELARGGTQRPHLRYLATLTPIQRKAAMSPTGLPFTEMTLAQQQQFLSDASRYKMDAFRVELEELAHATLRIAYTQPGGFRWKVTEGPSGNLERSPVELSLVSERTREAALQAARRIDPQLAEAQIAPSELALIFLYTWGSPKAGTSTLALRATTDGATIW